MIEKTQQNYASASKSILEKLCQKDLAKVNFKAADHMAWQVKNYQIADKAPAVESDRYGAMLKRQPSKQRRQDLRGKVSERDIERLEKIKSNYCFDPVRTSRIQKLRQAKS